MKASLATYYTVLHVSYTGLLEELLLLSLTFISEAVALAHFLSFKSEQYPCLSPCNLYPVLSSYLSLRFLQDLPPSAALQGEVGWLPPFSTK